MGLLFKAACVDGILWLFGQRSKRRPPKSQALVQRRANIRKTVLLFVSCTSLLSWSTLPHLSQYLLGYTQGAAAVFFWSGICSLGWWRKSKRHGIPIEATLHTS